MTSRRTVLRLLAGAASSGVIPSFDRSATAEVVRVEAPVRPVTRGPKAHFFGYYDKCPWDATGRFLLGMEIDFCDHQPAPGDELTVGMIDLEDGDRFLPLDRTAAWSWQQGTMLQWLGSAPDREIIYNGVDGDRYVAIIRDVHSGTSRTLPRPIYAIDASGSTAVTLDFDRLNRLRPGYGYNALPESHPDDPAPEDLGIYAMNLATGENRLIIPLSWAASNRADDRFSDDAHHWFNHLQFNPSGTFFIFLHRWGRPGTRWATRMYVARPDGSDIRLIQDTGMVSHFDWEDDRTILAWSTTPDQGNAFYRFDIERGTVEPMGRDVLPRDGHCSYSPDRRWILNDTYPDANRMQTLMVYRPEDNLRVEVGSFYLTPELSGPVRCDLHPRWNRDGTKACIDSAHVDATRQLYIVDLESITRG
ncbi:hypothetical protein [Tautonia sociabilis]|uniref:Oligogalacturonate lyase domain-containing protein n=1 Tax=Tautonia sociabilis TaxID=2080755 RepID=A0A432MQG0_9BACT|nr:hypothetical protein [Tautonia sociabilis]RUL89377.1 hypothetical protein TsocGM_02915 [Tautonia sociabilis]